MWAWLRRLFERPAFWRKRTKAPAVVSTGPSIQDIEQIRHEVKNAMLGIKLELRHQIRAVNEKTESLVKIRDHCKRIDEVLK